MEGRGIELRSDQLLYFKIDNLEDEPFLLLAKEWFVFLFVYIYIHPPFYR